MVSKDAIANAEAERNALVWECHQMLRQISRRSIGLKLLRLAKAHLSVLVKYKIDRSRARGNSSN